jgi:hypothetical protein
LFCTFEPGCRISAFPEGLFPSCKSLHSIHIPSSIEALGPYCFSRCPCLAVVTFERGSCLSTIHRPFVAVFYWMDFAFPARLNGLGQDASSIAVVFRLSHLSPVQSFAGLETKRLVTVTH